MRARIRVGAASAWVFEQRAEPAHPFSRILGDPEHLHRRGNIEAELDRPTRQRPGKRGAQIVLLDQRDRKLKAAVTNLPCAQRRTLGNTQEERRVTAMSILGERRFIQALQRVLANGLEHAEPPAAPTSYQAFDDERLETIEVSVADGFRGAKRERATEHGQPAKERLLVGREQLIAPLDGRSKRALPARRIARVRREERQSSLESSQQLVRVE